MSELDTRSSAELIDFPCSRIWREYYAETMDGIDLPSIRPRESELTERINKLEGKINSIKLPTVECMRGELLYLRAKVNELTDIRKKKKGGLWLND